MHHNVKCVKLSLDLLLVIQISRSKLYTLIEHNYDQFHTSLSQNIRTMIEAGSWQDSSAGGRRGNLTGVLVFKVVSTIYAEYA